MVCVALDTRLDVSADVDAARWVCRMADMWVREEEEEAEGEEGGLSATDKHDAVSNKLASRSVTLSVTQAAALQNARTVQIAWYVRHCV